MVKCAFSGEMIPPGTGIMYVLKDGKVLHFKNKKCEKNYLQLKRKPLKTRWSQKYEKKGAAPAKKKAAASKDTK